MAVQMEEQLPSWTELHQHVDIAVRLEAGISAN